MTVFLGSVGEVDSMILTYKDARRALDAISMELAHRALPAVMAVADTRPR